MRERGGCIYQLKQMEVRISHTKSASCTKPMPIYFKFECKSGAVDPEFQRLILVFEITFVNCRFHDGNVRKHKPTPIASNNH